jgi:SAM-dependent methyltransferase
MKSTGYRVLSAIYDRWQLSYGKDYSSLIFPHLLKTFRRYAIKSSRLLDVACGTGSLAILLRPYGWQIHCVDGSAGMIREARRKTMPYRPRITVSHQDMRCMHIRRRFDVATCMFDSINHLTTRRDLRSTFRGIHNALNPGGWFIFDVNNEACYRTLWKGTQRLEHRDFTLRLDNSFDPVRRLGQSRVHLRWQGSSRRGTQTETVVERCFSRSELKESLAVAGFQLLEGEDFNFVDIPGMGNLKSWWVAQKK